MIKSSTYVAMYSYLLPLLFIFIHRSGSALVGVNPNFRILSPSVMFHWRALVARPYNAFLIITVQSFFSPNYVPAMVYTFFVVSAWIKAFPMSPVTKLNPSFNATVSSSLIDRC